MAGVSFDRAADYYDETRALPGEAADAVTAILAAELAGRRPALEVGVGTGRMALPLHALGLGMLGVDISMPMLRRLRSNPGGGGFPVALADATQLPFPGHSVGATVASHVLHLIPEWRQAVEEVVRVTRPGGALLVDVGGNSGAALDSPWRQATDAIMVEHGLSRARPGVR